MKKKYRELSTRYFGRMFLLLIFSLMFLGNQSSGLTGDLVIFNAGSLSVPLKEVSAKFMEKNLGVHVLAEAAGSVDSARKILDLGRPCDVLALADPRVVDEFLMPTHVAYNILFARNEMVLAYTERSKHRGEINKENWYKILLRPEVTFGRSDPDRDPCGYRTLMVLQLSEKKYKVKDFSNKLLEPNMKFMRPKETDLLALLEAGEVDYAMIYRSLAIQHHLPYVSLSERINLATPRQDKYYRTAQVKIRGKEPNSFVSLTGEAIAYSVTIPKNASHPELAEAYLAFLLSKEGQKIIFKNGHKIISPATTRQWSALPKKIKPLCSQE